MVAGATPLFRRAQSTGRPPGQIWPGKPKQLSSLDGKRVCYEHNDAAIRANKSAVLAAKKPSSPSLELRAGDEGNELRQVITERGVEKVVDTVR